MNDLIQTLARELDAAPEHVENVVRLIDEGATIPFIARYRKELHGSMDDQLLRRLADRLQYLRGLAARKEEVRAAVEGQGKLTEDLSAALDAAATLAQIRKLADLGCDIIRCAVPDMDAALALKEITAKSPIPVIADIHFDYRLALQALESGVDGLRLNPGNIGGSENVRAVVEAAKPRQIPIRIGVNAGSLPKDLLEKYGHPTAEALVEAAWRHIHILEEMDYGNIKVSLKCHDVPLTLDAYRLLAGQCDYPLHVGITEAGTVHSGLIKSAVGIGTLLAEGIGDTIRVSLTGDPAEEVKAGFEILKALGLRQHGPTLISCPTCGRTSINLEKLAAQVERRLADIKDPITVAVMGCVVNGPGEGREADIGICGGKGEGLVFRKGEILKKVPEAELVPSLFAEIDKLLEERKKSEC